MDFKNDKGQVSIIMVGATGAVGGATLTALINMELSNDIIILGRRLVENVGASFVKQYSVDLFNPTTYKSYIDKQEVAICTLGVGQPSKVSKDEFIKIDKSAVLDFARTCKNAGIKHFQLLSSVGIDKNSKSFYLRTKGELVEELKSLQFDSLSIFQPSMIITPNNRYGFSQALVLFIWPIIDKLFFGSLSKYKGVKVKTLGKAIAHNALNKAAGVHYYCWNDFQKSEK